MVLGLGSALSIGSSLLGGVLGSRSERKAQKQQLAFINKAVGRVDDAVLGINDAQSQALTSVDEANAILAGIEPAVLAGMDEQLRIRTAEMMRRDAAEQAQLEQRAAVQGLDSSTVLPSLQRGQRYGQAQRLGGVAAQFAGQRAGIQMSARQGVANGLMNRAGTIQSFAGLRANTELQAANIFGGVQVAPSNVGAQIGALGGSIANAFSHQALLDSLRSGGNSTGLAPGQVGPPLPPL